MKKKEGEGYEYEAAEASFNLLVIKQLGLYKPLAELNNYHLESFKTGGFESKTIGRVFLELGLIEQWGSGILRIFDEASRLGFPEPTIEEKVLEHDTKIATLEQEIGTIFGS